MPSSDNIPNSNPKAINAVKEYVAPIFMGIVGLFLWRDISEMRSDVKLLLTQQSADKIRIENVITDVATLKTFVFGEKGTNTFNPRPTQPAKKEDELELR